MEKQFYLIKSIRILIGSLLVIIFGLLFLYAFSYLLPPPELMTERNTIFYDVDGHYLGEEKGLESRYWIPLEDMPSSIIDATISSEDQHFFNHYGFDLPRIGSALIKNMKNMSLKEGASTLTQQYARNLFLTHDKTWKRKIKEAFYTIRIETHYSKEEILEGYLNTIYYGHGAYGVEAASRRFFNKSVQQLTIAEAAMIAGIPKGPSYYSPLVDRERAENRQKVILQILQTKGVISQSTYEQAINESLHYYEQKQTNSRSTSPFFQDEALKEAAAILQTEIEDIQSGGYNIYTTFKKNEQMLLEEKINDRLTDNNDIQIGAISMDPHTGAIQALVGGRDYESSSFNRATMAKRTPGSTFKPFLYYAALEKNFTPVTRLRSERTAFNVNGDIYQPRNFNNNYADKPITLAQALALSDNIYAVKTHLFLGVDELVQTAKTFGFNDSIPAVPSLALGTASVSVKEMSVAFSRLANGGQKVDGYTIEEITDTNNNTVYKRDNELEQLFNEQSIFILTDLLTGMFDSSLNDYMNVTGLPITQMLSRQYAGKSGSTDYDSWMIGYSPSLVTAIWLGYDDNKKLNSPLDYTHAKQIWADYMESSHLGKETEEFPVPDGVIQVEIDPESGQIATKNCPQSRMMYFKTGTEPRSYCSTHNNNELDKIKLERNKERRGFLKRLFDFLFKE